MEKYATTDAQKTYPEKLHEAYRVFADQLGSGHDVAVILGSGLGNLPEDLADRRALAFGDIPHFPRSGVKGHKGRFVAGSLSGKKVLFMQGRVHYYEGHSMQNVTMGVRLMQKAGIPTLIVTNASGGLRKAHYPGSLCLIHDHLNLMGDNPLRGKNLDEFGPRFPDMTHAYTPELIELAKQVAERINLPLFTGVYAGVSGPNYETRAEIHYLRTIGADLVGMSTVPEVLVAVHGGMKVLGISCITDAPVASDFEPVTHEDVIAAAARAQLDFLRLLSGIIAEL
ncbi:MAG: purine-nucleoside phosphorylase [Bacteroidetes bacterium]|nr:MAG: purine-nucleoside phosphorylase [Bacteroidota bacterium]